MRLITNTTLQGLYIPFNTEYGIIDLFIRPKSSVEIPNSYTSKILETLIRRRQVTSKNLIGDKSISSIKQKIKK